MLKYFEFLKLEYKLKPRHIIVIQIGACMVLEMFFVYQSYQNERNSIYNQEKQIKQKYQELHLKATNQDINIKLDQGIKYIPKGSWLYTKLIQDKQQLIILEQDYLKQKREFAYYLSLYMISGISFPILTSAHAISNKIIKQQQLEQEQQMQYIIMILANLSSLILFKKNLI